MRHHIPFRAHSKEEVAVSFLAVLCGSRIALEGKLFHKVAVAVVHSKVRDDENAEQKEEDSSSIEQAELHHKDHK